MTSSSRSGGRLNVARLLGRADRQQRSDPNESWKTCDRDHDTVLDQCDDCPDQPGIAERLPRRGPRGVRDGDDNCPAAYNPDQADADGDGSGDECDATKRGEDLDGDAKAALDDRCRWSRAGCRTAARRCPSPRQQRSRHSGAIRSDPDAGACSQPGRADLARGQGHAHRVPRLRPPLHARGWVTVKFTARRSWRSRSSGGEVQGRWVWDSVQKKSLAITARGRRTLTVRARRRERRREVPGDRDRRGRRQAGVDFKV